MTPPSSEQYAELAALFTTAPDESTKPSIELLLPAHLPVQGGLWLVPYAGREAGAGTVVLVRMHEETVDVAIIGAGSIDLFGCTSMEEVLERTAKSDVHWIVQPPVDADPTSLLHCDADTVTLLSGADQAAVVGAYRLLKGLITSAGDDETFPAMRLVVVGAEDKAATDAASRIVQTAELQLEVSVDVGPALPAMGSSCNVVSQVSFSRESNVVDLMGRIRNAHDAEEQLKTTERLEHPAVKEQAEVASEKTVEKPVYVVENTTREEESSIKIEMDYASYIDGLLAIAPRCPEHEHVELAVDTDGRLHVLSDANDLRDASIVSSWIVRHRALVAMACGGLKLDETLTPVQHLFTDDAVSVADLHGTDLRMHLLAEIVVGEQASMFCTPLN
jgi:hypothetical protein